MSALKILIFLAMTSTGTADIPEIDRNVEVPPVQQVGHASWYGAGNWHGEITANGEKFDPNDHTCAHRELPFNTVVLVENRANGKRSWCRINDRGPYDVVSRDGELVVDMNPSPEKHTRIIDVSVAVAKEIGLYNAGIGRVSLRYSPRRATFNSPAFATRSATPTSL